MTIFRVDPRERRIVEHRRRDKDNAPETALNVPPPPGGLSLIRPERHIPNSIATVRRRLIVALTSTLRKLQRSHHQPTFSVACWGPSWPLGCRCFLDSEPRFLARVHVAIRGAEKRHRLRMRAWTIRSATLNGVALLEMAWCRTSPVIVPIHATAASTASGWSSMVSWWKSITPPAFAR